MTEAAEANTFEAYENLKMQTEAAQKRKGKKWGKQRLTYISENEAVNISKQCE